MGEEITVDTKSLLLDGFLVDYRYKMENLWKSCNIEQLQILQCCISIIYLLSCGQFRSPIIKQMWMVAASSIMVEIWFLRNKMVIENVVLSFCKIKNRVTIHYIYSLLAYYL